MIQLHHVWKVYEVGPIKVTALTDVSLKVGRGEFVCLVGPSGAGKTTLLRLLYRDELPTEGELLVDGHEVATLRRSKIPELRRMIGVVFQDARLLPSRTVFENVAFILQVLGAPRKLIAERAFECLKAVGLAAKAHAFPAQLSQGEQQRVALARALVKEPLLLLADEPTGNLDERMAGEILELLRAAHQRGTTVLLATHRVSLGASVGERRITLHAGQIVADSGSGDGT
ncbi:MAG TPA: cell division ATP-binding protein FtsE [Methylomirabilota bacterium]|nr:cell division ATP-binding protein FtsE [Methylomirabilota bacterium]